MLDIGHRPAKTQLIDSPLCIIDSFFQAECTAQCFDCANRWPHLGPYEIFAAIGTSWTSEVYRASMGPSKPILLF